MNKNDIKVLIENIAEDSFCEFSEPSINKITNKLYNLVKNFDGDDPYQIKEDLESINIQEKYTMDFHRAEGAPENSDDIMMIPS